MKKNEQNRAKNTLNANLPICQFAKFEYSLLT